MLSAESAWRVLHAEHRSMRQLSDAIDAALLSDEWRRPGPGLEAVRAPLQRLQTFNDDTHRPKGVVLRTTLRGRSAQSDALLDELESDHGRCERLIERGLSLLDAIESGDRAAAEALPAVLREHRATLLHHLEREDTLLHSHTARLLTAAEWSKVVSSISSVVQSAVARDRGQPAAQAPRSEIAADARRRGMASPTLRSASRRGNEV